jgi:hypothetical protein
MRRPAFQDWHGCGLDFTGSEVSVGGVYSVIILVVLQINKARLHCSKFPAYLYIHIGRHLHDVRMF